MTKSLMEIAAEIVQGQMSQTIMSSEDIVSSLRSVFGTLMTMRKAETEDVDLDLCGSVEQIAQAGTVSIKTAPTDSIREDSVVCLECGLKLKQVTAKHLQSHGLSPREYKKKWGFSMKQPLVAKSLTRARSKAAKKRGLPDKLRAYVEARKLKRDSAAVQAETP
ncbi:MAG: MucR family transcriptional regulator [Syntrophobacteraceae bacterium]